MKPCGLTAFAKARKTLGHGSLAALVSLGLINVGCSSSNAQSGVAGDTAPAADAYCTQNAETLLSACNTDAMESELVAMAACNDIEDETDRAACLNDAADEADEEQALCNAQRSARGSLCSMIGEARYDPSFEPSDFVDPSAIGGAVAPNPFFPLVVGNQWVYEDSEETITVTVTAATKRIDGVDCRVVVDSVENEDGVVEVTDDWYAQDTIGNVWYCGELSRNFEVFGGDAPMTPELVDLDGSFKVGEDGARPGIVMPAQPIVGDVYRQEVAYGEAEDVGEILSVTGTETSPGGSCNGTCLVTRDFTPLEPDANENKYYAPGIGLIVETKPDEGERLELLSFTPG